MKISLQWLKSLIDLNHSPEEIAQTLTSVGLEVEELEKKGYGLQHVVCGEVKECTRHPNADKLSVCQVYDGLAQLQVVCGAPNVKAGQKVLLARVGAVLPGNFSIKPSKIRGVDSQGMLCAEDELGLGTHHDGIMVLPEDTQPGIPLDQIPGLSDCIFTVNVTPNRPDALCHVGIARELSAAYGLPLNLRKAPTDFLPQSFGPSLSATKSFPQDFSVELVDKANCPRYTARLIKGVKVGPSPLWLKQALASIGQKSINNIVDLTNFVLFERNQPSHVFDLNQLMGQKICIRPAYPQEKLTTLDGIERTLTTADLVIADAQKAHCLAGVMGGLESAVTESTTDILLEVAYFHPPCVRSAAKRHGLSSDSSYRFERGIDPLTTQDTSSYLTHLIVELAGGVPSPVLLEDVSNEFSFNKRQAKLRPARVKQMLGYCPELQEINTKFKAIGMEILSTNNQETLYTLPGFRPDLEQEIDLVEETARLFDYNTIPALLPKFEVHDTTLPASEVLAQKLRHHLASRGLHEALSLRFSNPTFLQSLGFSPEFISTQGVSLQNPLSDEWRILPPSASTLLLQGLLNNQKIGIKNARLFEWGKCFVTATHLRSNKKSGVEEIPVLSLALAGSWPTSSWENPSSQSNLYNAKGLIEDIWNLLHLSPKCFIGRPDALKTSSLLGKLPQNSISFNNTPHIHPGECITWYLGNRVLGWLGTLHPVAKNATGLKEACILAELFPMNFPSGTSLRRFQSYSKQTCIEREMNILVDAATTHQSILDALTQKETPHLKDIRLNSIYTGQGIPPGKKALHYTFTYQHPEESLTDELVNAWQEQLAEGLSKHPGVSFK